MLEEMETMASAQSFIQIAVFFNGRYGQHVILKFLDQASNKIGNSGNVSLFLQKLHQASKSNSPLIIFIVLRVMLLIRHLSQRIQIQKNHDGRRGLQATIENLPQITNQGVWFPSLVFRTVDGADAAIVRRFLENIRHLLANHGFTRVVGSF